MILDAIYNHREHDDFQKLQWNHKCITSLKKMQSEEKTDQ